MSLKAHREVILIVEDDELFAQALKDFLDELNFITYLAQTNWQAYDIMSSYEVDRIIFDYSVLNGDTKKLVAKVKEIEPDVICYANSGDPENNDVLMKAGCDKLLGKNPDKIVLEFIKDLTIDK